jgi:hypothetical protein
VTLETALALELVASRLAAVSRHVRVELQPSEAGGEELHFVATSADTTLARLYSPPTLIGSIVPADEGSTLSAYWRDPRLWFHRSGYLGVGAFGLFVLGAWMWGAVTGSEVRSDQGDPLFPQVLLPLTIVLAALVALSLYRSIAKRRIMDTLENVLEGDRQGI